MNEKFSLSIPSGDFTALARVSKMATNPHPTFPKPALPGHGYLKGRKYTIAFDNDYKHCKQPCSTRLEFINSEAGPEIIMEN